ncbi:DNA topoisomerase 2, partial [Cladochytrium tenue]
MLARLTNDWTRLDNRVRFILEIIDGKLRVQNRKRVELLADLRDRGYVPMPKAASKTSRAKADAASDGEDEDYGELAESGSPDANATGSYHYLLGMPIWSLTTEKVNQLKREREEKQTEIDWLMEKSPKQLWTTDLDTFLARWEGYEKNLAKLEAIVPKRSKSPIKSGAKGAAKPRKRVVKKKSSSDDDDDDDAIVDDDSDDDFKAAPTKASKPKAEPKPRVKKEPAVDKKSKAEGAKSGASDSMAKFLEKMNA